jgi:hypothetical protein
MTLARIGKECTELIHVGSLGHGTECAVTQSGKWETNHMHGLLVVLFAVAAGFTASGIVASIYRIVATSPESDGQKTVRHVVLAVAGPTVFFGTATRLLLKKELSPLLFSFAIMALSYWSFAVGLFVLNVAISF